MSFHPRKLFHQYLSSNDATMEWRPIYSPTPSPLSPISVSVSLPWLPPLPDEDHLHKYYVLIIITVIGSTCGVVLLLITMNKILRYYNSRRYCVSRTNPPILFDIRGDSPFSDDEEPTMRHPISWFIPSEGLQQSIIDSITVFKYTKDEGLIEGTECLICLSEFQQEESLKLLPKCSHAFHVPCIDTWFRSHKNCPLCRAPIVHDAGGDTEMVRTTESDSSFSNMNEDIEESESSVVDEDSSEDGGRVSVIHDKVLCHSPISIDSACVVSGNEFEEEIEHMRRCVSADSSLDIESSDTNLVVENNVSFSSNNDVIAKHGGENSTIYKMALIDQDRHFSLRRSSSSHNRKFIFSRRSWSQSSTFPL